MKCRIALAVSADGSYSACGGSTPDLQDQNLFIEAARDGLPDRDTPYKIMWVEVEVDIPEVVVVEGKVAG